MNPEKFSINKETPESTLDTNNENYTEREKNQSLADYDVFVNQKLNEALDIKRELEPIRKQRQEKVEDFDFQKWGELEFALKQRARNILAEARDIEARYNMKVERPNFKEILGEEGLDEEPEHQQAA